MPAAFRGLFEPCRYKAFHGGRGSAKSHSFATALVILAAQRPLRIVCAREIQNSLRDSVKQLVEDKILTLGLSDRFVAMYSGNLGLAHSFDEFLAAARRLRDRTPSLR